MYCAFLGVVNLLTIDQGGKPSFSLGDEASKAVKHGRKQTRANRIATALLAVFQLCIRVNN